MRWLQTPPMRLRRVSHSHIRCLSVSVDHRPPPVVLRPYQEDALDACTDALAGGASRIGVSLPTGSGKTTVFLTLLSRIAPPPENPKATRALVIVNAIELARQAAAQAERLFPGWTVEIEQGAKHKASGLADVTMATYQTLRQPERLAKFNPATLKAIIIDEAHHAAAPSYRSLLSHFHPAIEPPVNSPDAADWPPDLPHTIPIVGFSATFSRHDGLALGSVFERIVYHDDFMSMIKEQWLCNVRFTSVKATINLRGVTVNSRSGDFNASSLAHVINTPTVNRLVVNAWLDKAPERKSTLVFCVNLAHVRDLTNAFREAGVDARYLHSLTPAAERKALIAAFREGQFSVLVNCAILTEGADIPNIDCVVVARPTRSRNVFAQMIGRGMRLSPETGKEDCRIIDFVDSTARVAGVVSVPSLLGLDPDELLDDVTVEDLEKRAARALDMAPEIRPETGDNVPDPTSVTFVDHDDPFSFADSASGAPHIAQISPNAWVGCGGDIYVLECLGKGHVRIEPITDDDTGAHFRAHYTPAMMDMGTAKIFKISPFARSRQILTAATLVDAVHGADVYAETKVVRGERRVGLRRSAAWRRQPASLAQVAFVRIKWQRRGAASLQEIAAGVTSASSDVEERLEKLTKGEAANIIARLKHGAQARHEKKGKIAKRVNEKAAKESMRKAREVVQVGTLPNVPERSML